MVVDGEIHRGHTAATELSVDAVFAGETLSQAFERVGHFAPLVWRDGRRRD
jgi:hypothetical protein